MPCSPSSALAAAASALVAVAAFGCRSNYDHVGVPPPETRHGIRVRVSGLERGALRQFRAVHGEAVNETGEALRACALRFTGLDFSAEKIAEATATRDTWAPGELWRFRAAFPIPGVEDVHDVVFEGVSYELAPPPTAPSSRGAR